MATTESRQDAERTFQIRLCAAIYKAFGYERSHFHLYTPLVDVTWKATVCCRQDNT